VDQPTSGLHERAKRLTPIVVAGVVALTVVDGHDDGSVQLVSASGQQVDYDLRSQTVTVH